MDILIGRENYLQGLLSILKNSRKRMQVCFLSGEAGVGKTALLNSFIENAKSMYPDLLVAGSKCHGITGSHPEPYLPFAQILGELSEKETSKYWEKIQKGIVELAPDWIQIIPGGSFLAAIIKTAQWGRRELVGSENLRHEQRYIVQYANALRELSKLAPLLIWIDDLQWADNATLDLISFLTDQIKDSGVLLVLNFRSHDTEYEELNSIRKLRGRLNRLSNFSEFELKNFTIVELREYLNVTQHSFPEDFANRLQDLSGGNPLYIREYVNLLHAKHLVKRVSGKFFLVNETVSPEIPQNLINLIKERLSIIDKDLRRVLAFASVQGERFGANAISFILKSPELDVIEKLNLLDRVHNLIKELEQENLIVKLGVEYQFIHALVQQVLYSDLSVGQKHILHSAIGEWMEDVYGALVNRYAADIAPHYEKGGKYEKAIYYYFLACENAISVLALDDAVLYAEAADLLLKDLPDDNMSREYSIDLLLIFARIHCLRAEFDSALKCCVNGQALSHKNFYEKHARFLYWHSMILDNMGNHNDAITPVLQALELSQEFQLSPDIVGALNIRLGSFYQRLPLKDVEDALERAMLIAEENFLIGIKLNALLQKEAVVINRRDNPEEALSLGYMALGIAQSNNLLHEQIRCRRAIARTCRELKRGDEALVHNIEAVALSKKLGLPDGDRKSVV